MRRRSVNRTLTGILVVFLAALFGVGYLAVPAYASSGTTPLPKVTSANPVASKSALYNRGGVTISPAFQQIVISPDSQSVSFNFTVTNNTSQEQEFALSVVDFGSLDETGGVLFAGNAQKTLDYRYALSQWVTLERDRIVVPPRGSEKVPITIVNKESLTPGGHYGAIMVNPTDSGDKTGRKVNIDQVASSLLFVKKAGGEVYKLDLQSYKIGPHIFSLPGSVAVRFQNAGNIHVIPRGLAVLTDPWGKVVKRGIVNADSGIALPETFRSLQVPLESIGSAWLPGRYKLTVTYRYDDVVATRTVETSFVYLNALTVLMAVGLLCAVAVLALNPTARRQVFAVPRKLLHRIRP